MADAGEFNLIVTGVDSQKVADAAKAFAGAFSLDDTIATQICKSAPIIFAQKLTKAEVKAITPSLTKLSETGIEFRVTARVGAKLPKVNWPSRPQFTAGGSAGVNGLAFKWDNNAFVCPGCGDTFLFRRLGKLSLAEAASNGGAAAPARTPAAVGAAAGGGDVGFAPPRPTVEGVEGLQEVPGEGESLDFPETVEEIKLDDSPAEPELVPEPEAAADPEPLEEPIADDDFNVEPLEEQATPVPAAAPEPVPEPEPEPEAAAPVEEEAPPEGAELYNVFLSKITDTSKRDKAATLIAQVKGCSASEAKELTTRLVIPLAKNVQKGKAEEILASFKKLKIFGRMTKVK